MPSFSVASITRIHVMIQHCGRCSSLHAIGSIDKIASRLIVIVIFHLCTSFAFYHDIHLRRNLYIEARAYTSSNSESAIELEASDTVSRALAQPGEPIALRKLNISSSPSYVITAFTLSEGVLNGARSSASERAVQRRNIRYRC